MTYYYRIYGLHLCSDLEFPELEKLEDFHNPIDIRITLETSRIFEGETTTTSPFLSFSDEFAIFATEKLGVFTIRAGQEIIVEPAPEITPADLRPILLGSIIAILLYQRGLTVLHSSAAARDGKATTFLGQKGEGKSVTVLSLCQHGFDFVADDIAAIDQSASVLQIQPSYPKIRLWEDAIDSMGYAYQEMPLVHPQIAKRHYPAPDMVQAPVELSRICILATADIPRMVQLSPEQAFFQVLCHSYLSRWANIASRMPQHFFQITSLVNKIPVYRLERPRDFKSLPALLDLLREQA